MKTAVLLAAGRGSRLRPYTDVTPKPLLPVQGKPTLDYYFQALQAVGCEQVVLVTHHLADQIEQYAQQVPQRFEMACATVRQHTLDGTASALEAAAVQLHNDDTFLLMATDYLLTPEFMMDLVSFHKEHGDDMSVSLKRVPKEELSSRSSVRFDADHRITEIVEKPEPGKAPSELGANLAFILPAAFVQYVPSVTVSARGEREVQSAINAYLANGGRARGLIQETPSEWTPEIRE